MSHILKKERRKVTRVELEEYFSQKGLEFKNLPEIAKELVLSITQVEIDEMKANDKTERMYLSAKIDDFDFKVCEILSAFAKTRFPGGKFYLSRALISFGRRILWSVYYPDQDAFEFKQQKSFYYVSVALVFNKELEERGFEIKGVAGAQLMVGPTTGELVAALANAFPVNRLNSEVYIS